MFKKSINTKHKKYGTFPEEKIYTSIEEEEIAKIEEALLKIYEAEQAKQAAREAAVRRFTTQCFRLTDRLKNGNNDYSPGIFQSGTNKQLREATPLYQLQVSYNNAREAGCSDIDLIILGEPYKLISDQVWILEAEYQRNIREAKHQIDAVDSAPPKPGS